MLNANVKAGFHFSLKSFTSSGEPFLSAEASALVVSGLTAHLVYFLKFVLDCLFFSRYRMDG